jgi:hypothetical protein
VRAARLLFARALGRAQRGSQPRNAPTTAWCVVSDCSGLTEMRPLRTAWMSDISSLSQWSLPSSIQ